MLSPTACAGRMERCHQGFQLNERCSPHARTSSTHDSKLHLASDQKLLVYAVKRKLKLTQAILRLAKGQAVVLAKAIIQKGRFYMSMTY